MNGLSNVQNNLLFSTEKPQTDKIAIFLIRQTISVHPKKMVCICRRKRMGFWQESLDDIFGVWIDQMEGED